MTVIKPITYHDLITNYGEPGSGLGLIKRVLPFPMVASWDKDIKITRIYAHKLIVPAALEAFEEILEIYGLDFIQAHGLDEFGGTFSNRLSRSGWRKSVHAWGMALDYLPSLGPYGKPSLIPYEIAIAFTSRGFIWGQKWTIQDSMHWSGVFE